MKQKKSFIILSSIFLLCSSANNVCDLKPCWDNPCCFNWNNIDLNDEVFWPSLSFPSNFKWGVATSAFQIEGTKSYNNQHVHNNFTYDEHSSKEIYAHCDHWNRFKKDVQLIKNLGVNQYRFSISWEKIEPREGVFDECALEHYADLCKELLKHNIEPVICLFHFTMPVWFYLQDGFEKEANIKKFERFCLHVFERLKDYALMWITYNEPIAYVMEAYHMGEFPPYKKGVWYLRAAGTVLRNMLTAHVNLYKAFKAQKKEAQIGFAHMFHLLDTQNDRWLERFVVAAGNTLMHDVIFDFFTSGTFNWLHLVKTTNPDAPKALDFIGVNYYTREMVSQKGYSFEQGPLNKKEQITDMNWAVYPEGLYRAIIKASSLNIPIYITENGLATTSDSLRNHFIKQHLYVVHKALQDGFDIRGYHHWSLMDNYEWKHGFNKKFGLYEVDFLTQERILRAGAQPFVHFLQQQSAEK